MANEFLPFASSGSPNVLTQSEWAVDGQRPTGFQTGTARSKAVNKAIRQGANMASALGALIDSRGGSALDNGDITALATALTGAFSESYSTVTGSAALTVGQAGLVVIQVTGVASITLPRAAAANGRPLQYQLARADQTSAMVTVSATGGDSIENGGASLDLPANARVTLRSNGTGIWWVVADTVRNLTVTSPGVTRLPGGLILQQGSGGTTTGQQNIITLPVTYPNAHFLTIAGEQNAVGWESGGVLQPRWFGCAGRTLSSFTLTAAVLTSGGTVQFASGTGFHFISLGR